MGGSLRKKGLGPPSQQSGPWRSQRSHFAQLSAAASISAVCTTGCHGPKELALDGPEEGPYKC